MKMLRMTMATMAAVLVAGPALAHDCGGRIDEFERLLDITAKQAISASSGGQAVAGARMAQAIEDTTATTEETVVPFQDEAEEVEAVEEAEAAGNAGEFIIEARTALQQARELAETGDEQACATTVDNLILTLLNDLS